MKRSASPEKPPAPDHSMKRRNSLAHFEVIHSITGQPINLNKPVQGFGISMRIDDNTTLEWILPHVARALHWPASHVRLTAGETAVGYTHRISERGETYLKNILGPGQPKLIIQATKLARPERFERGECLCDFGGCCCDCMALGIFAYVCPGCGYNGLCGLGDCGHQCCEDKRKPSGATRTFVDRCKIEGCQPYWLVCDYWDDSD